MCIKIVNDGQEIPYDMFKPLEDQMVGCKQIIVDYEPYAPYDKEVDVFLKEVQRFAKTGIDANLNIKVIHNNNLTGFKNKKKIKQATNAIALNDIIKLMVNYHSDADKKLKELASDFKDTVK